MKYSFVIPSYNYKDYLVNCLESLNHQIGFGTGDYEVVVVDDGSNDGTYDAIHSKKFSFPLNYIYIKRTANSCRNAARNTGWKNAKGEIVIFLDADMIVRKDYLQNLNQCYEMDNTITVMGLRFMLSEPVSLEQIKDGAVFNISNPTSKPDMKYLEERHYFFNTLSYNAASFDNPWLYFYSCNVSISKKQLLLVGGFNENLPGWGFDDQELGYRLFDAGVKLIINKQIEGLHQFHGEIYGMPSNEQKILQWYRNVNLTYSLNKDLQRIAPKFKLLCCFAFKMVPSMSRRKYGFRKKHIFKVRGKSSVERLKASIKSLADAKGNEIIVYDEGEDSDLHIWVQFLGRTESPVKYYPASRFFKKDSIEEHKKYLKRTYPRNRALYLVKMALKAYART